MPARGGGAMSDDLRPAADLAGRYAETYRRVPDPPPPPPPELPDALADVLAPVLARGETLSPTTAARLLAWWTDDPAALRRAVNIAEADGRYPLARLWTVLPGGAPC